MLYTVYMNIKKFLPDFSTYEETPVEVVQEDEHYHQWESRYTTYAPPRRDVDPSGITNQDVLQKLLFGVTTTMSECLICHQRLVNEYLGSDRERLDEILDKVETFGVQYYQRDGNTYMIQKYQPQQPVVPIR